MKEWEMYERFLSKIITEENSHDLTVIPNARLYGKFSKRSRQIDILIDYRYDHDLSRRVIIDAKRVNRKIDVKDVEGFEGMMKDVSAHRGILVCPYGHTKSALRRAQETITIRLLSLSELDDFSISSWDRCLDSSCKNGLVLWDANPSLAIDSLWHIHAIGKCDRCGIYHVWCWDCGEKFTLGKEDEYRCGCNPPWFWLSSIESEDDEGSYKSCYLMIVLLDGRYIIVDRRPLN